MTPQGLAASAAINIGLAMAVFCIFSILKKQPSNSFIYYARRLSLEQQQSSSSLAFDRFSFRRLMPSFSWIIRGLRVPEDDILRNFGLDALIIIRLFKFGIRFFVVCSVIGLIILLPLNYFSQSSEHNHSHYMNSFTISNIEAGSDSNSVSPYGLQEYEDILAKRTLWLHELKDRPDRFTILVREIPLCAEHKMYECSVYHFFTRHYRQSFQSHQMLYDGRDLDLLQEEAASIQRKIQKLREKSVRKISGRKGSLIEPLRGDASKIAMQEEKLRRVCDVIFSMQHGVVLQKMELPAAFVTFKSRVGATLAAQSQQHPHPFLWITDEAPEPRDLLWKNLSTPSRRLLLYKFVFFLAATLLTIFFTVPVAAVQGIAKFERLKKWFPPAMAIQFIPGLSSVVTGYLPGLILNGFIYIVPYSMLGMAHLAGYPSRRQTEIKVCNMVFYFLVGNVFFLSLLSGSLLDELGESFSHPGDFPSRLARAVAAQAGLLTWDAVKRLTFCRGKKRSPYLYSLPYFRVIPFVCLCFLIGMVYALVAPLAASICCWLFIYRICCLYEPAAILEYDSQFALPSWNMLVKWILEYSLEPFSVTMVGLFGLKSKPGALIASLPLLVFTLLFNEYCKLRFLPSFTQNTIQVLLQLKHLKLLGCLLEKFQMRFMQSCGLCSGIKKARNVKEDDEIDEKASTLEINSQNAADAYCPPFLRPTSFGGEGSSSDQQPV
ncbi:hypothetical protein RDABS01_040140 [Bienertia sinuspersici]